MQTLSQLSVIIEAELGKIAYPKTPQKLYQPIDYVMGLGGKRMRPILLLMAHQLFDKNIELVACGSSSDTMSTFPEWEREVLDITYDSVDYISMHRYWSNKEKNTTSFLSSNIGLQEYISNVESTINYIKSKK